MTFCPECNQPGAYVGLVKVECPNTRCKHYKPSAVPAGLIVAPGGGMPRPKDVQTAKQLFEDLEEVERLKSRLRRWKDVEKERKARPWNDPPFVHAFKSYLHGATNLFASHIWHEDFVVYPLRFAARLVGISFDPVPDGVSLRQLWTGYPHGGISHPIPISLAPKLQPIAPQMPAEVNGRVQMEFIYEGESRQTKELFPNERFEIFLWMRYMHMDEAQIWFPAR